MSLYSKFRPNQLEELVGQKNVVNTLKQSSINNNFSHAYLFGGERGCGKTTTARILATLINCENPKDGKACGICRPCKTIMKGAASDVVELNGATSRGIDETKALIESACWSPQEFKKKVYIIDEVHQLTKESISALLKILEEPPSYVTFILCTTETKKILPTILSRCQKFNFTKILSKDMLERLRHISSQENISIDDDALFIIAKMARGSMREAIGYLEQIAMANVGNNITNKTISEYFGVADRIGIFNIIQAIKSGNIPLLLDQINDLLIASCDIKQILHEISEILRNMMILKASNNDKLVDLSDNEISLLKKLGDGISIVKLVKLSVLFSNIDKKIDYNINERWIMEATLINCVSVLKE